MPEVLATVGGREIPRREFEIRYRPTAEKLLARRGDGRIPGAFEAMQRRKIIDGLIWSVLLELEAERSGVDVSPEDLAAFEAEERLHILDWPAWLARINQSEEIRRGKDVDYLRERALLEARVGALSPSEDQLRAAYEAQRDELVVSEPVIRASHLLFTYGPRVGDEKIQPLLPEQREAASEGEKARWQALALSRAKALRAKALEPGVDFNALAEEWSEGPGAFRGGDMGLFPKARMVPEYAEVAFALEPGEISEPVGSLKGFYVIKSFGRYEPGPLPFEAVRADLVRQLEREIYDAGHEALRKELEARFEVASPALDQARALEAK
nr:peptidylprolyl isomerase [Pseudenhygromyxa sp. WMMC2535]